MSWLFSLHVVLDFLDRGGGEFVFLHVCFLDICSVERQPMVWEGVVECLAKLVSSSRDGCCVGSVLSLCSTCFVRLCERVSYVLAILSYIS